VLACDATGVGDTGRDQGVGYCFVFGILFLNPDVPDLWIHATYIERSPRRSEDSGGGNQGDLAGSRSAGLVRGDRWGSRSPPRSPRRFQYVLRVSRYNATCRSG
jgi:hypothetical protein